MNTSKIIHEVNRYYTDKIKTNGATPQGVDWNSVESQTLRFKILCGIIQQTKDFSLIDYGCGFGSMLEYMERSYTDFTYHGYDISEEMIKQAKTLYHDHQHAHWYTSHDALPASDYLVASGIFNVRLEHTDDEWLSYILDTLHKMNQKTKNGFSFNMLTKYSDKEYMKDYLYYADPLFIFDYCKQHFSKYVTLQHDYPLYEFSILIKK